MVETYGCRRAWCRAVASSVGSGFAERVDRVQAVAVDVVMTETFGVRRAWCRAVASSVGSGFAERVDRVQAVAVDVVMIGVYGCRRAWCRAVRVRWATRVLPRESSMSRRQLWL